VLFFFFFFLKKKKKKMVTTYAHFSTVFPGCMAAMAGMDSGSAVTCAMCAVSSACLDMVLKREKRVRRRREEWRMERPSWWKFIRQVEKGRPPIGERNLLRGEKAQTKQNKIKKSRVLPGGDTPKSRPPKIHAGKNQNSRNLESRFFIFFFFFFFFFFFLCASSNSPIGSQSLQSPAPASVLPAKFDCEY
jgi:hypothetical protein